jgi:uncharacterized protein YjbI with pentapeptide repeats
LKSPTWVSAILLVTSISAATPKPQIDTEGLSPTEKWVAEQVSKGEQANLDEKFDKEEQRVVRAHFIEQLVTDTLPGYKAHRNGARMIGGIVRGPLDLNNARIHCEVWFDHFQFKGDVDLTRANFDDTLSFDEATIEGDLSLNGAKVGDVCSFTKTIFKKGVDFKTADIRGQLIADEAQFMDPNQDCDFNGTTIRGVASFEKAVFYGPVDFGSAIILGDLEADEATFKDQKEGVSFIGTKIGDTVLLSDAVFEGPVSFDFADIKGQFTLDDAKFKNVTEEASFNSMKVGDFFSLDGAVFEGPVDFSFMNVVGTLHANATTFKNETEATNFNSTVIGRDMRFQGTTFKGKTTFIGANIGENFDARDAKFTNKEQIADFNSVKIGNRAFVRNISFDGGVSFISVRVIDSFEGQEAKFNSTKQAASFGVIKIGRGAHFDKATFQGPVSFISAEIDSGFYADDSKFLGKQNAVSFNGVTVKSTCSFERAIFEGSVNFIAADVGANFQADDAQFTNETEPLYLQMNCGRKGFFRRVVFAGPVSFVDSTFLDLTIDPSPNSPRMPELDLSRASIRRQLEIKRVKVQNLIAPFLHVEGPANLTNLVVDRSVNLTYGDFGELDLSGSLWPKDAEAFQMQGMTYKNIRAAIKDSDSRKMLMQLADQAAYASDVYSNLEQFFSRQGNRDDADTIFIAGKSRERRQYLQGFHWLASWALYLLVGYGRHPIYVGGLCITLIAVGCFLFSKKNMELQKPTEKGDPPRVYNSFWYSVGLFLPFVDLQIDKLWKPRRSRPFLRNYARVHILLGWVLIPILLAALTGIIK